MSNKKSKNKRRRSATRSKRLVARSQYEEASRGAKEHRESVREREATLAAIRATEMARPRGREAVAERVLKTSAGRERRLMEVVAARAPKLFDAPYRAALRRVAAQPWQREPEAWKPKGRGRDRLFYGLMAHLLCRYPTPRVILQAAFVHTHGGGGGLMPLVVEVGAGGSLHKAIAAGALPLSLTRKQCHALMTSPAIGFVPALRRVLVRAHGGDARLEQAWLATNVGEELGTPEAERFWLSVLVWLARHPELDRRHVGPLVDYLGHRFHEAREAGRAAPEMKRRSPAALLRAMEGWHRELTRERLIKGEPFEPCGVPGLDRIHRVRTRDGELVEQRWRITEVLGSNELLREGRELKHCVYSYAWAIRRGATAIYSMTCNGKRRITIELDRRGNRVVQARGRLNRQTTKFEMDVLGTWARANGLEMVAARLR